MTLLDNIKGIGKVCELKIKVDGRNRKEEVDETYFRKGDNEKTGRDISIYLVESKEKNRLFEADLKGLCISKFSENITVDGVRFEELDVGMKISVGDMKIKITEIGKKCYAECELFRQKGKCFLGKEVLFAEIVKDGVVKKGDEFKYEKRQSS